MKNKIITSEGNVQFIFGDSSKVVNIHPFHIFTVFNDDTISFIQIAMPKSSGLALFTTKAEDLELNGSSYTFEQLKNVLAEAFAEAGAKARCEIVQTLPTTGKTNTIYLVPKSEGSGYDEYVYLKDVSRWELLGDTDIELSRYVKKTDFNSYTATTNTRLNDIESDIQTVSGNSYTKTEIDTKLSEKLDSSDFNTYSAATKTAIDNKLDASAYTPTDLSNYYTKSETSGATEIQNALNGKQDTLVAGNNITISGNVISATGGGGGAMTAGRAIDITNNVVSFTLPISAGTGIDSIIEGQDTHADGGYSHAEGSWTHADGRYSHAEGEDTTASGQSSHAEGVNTTASGQSSHAEGESTTANGECSHSEGQGTTAGGYASHAEGYGTTANNSYEHACGANNISSSASTDFGDSGNTLFTVGNGNSPSNYHNAIDVRQNGDIYIADTNGSGEFYQKPMIKLQDLLTSIDSLTARIANIEASLNI